jgi:hypothetical protein
MNKGLLRWIDVFQFPQPLFWMINKNKNKNKVNKQNIQAKK